MLHRIATGIAARLIIQPPPRIHRRRGIGEVESVPYRGGADELDLDHTLDVLSERRPLAAEDIIVRERRQRRQAVVLCVDVSGSMRGERVRTAAAAVGALTASLRQEDLAVIAFWSDAAMVLRFGEHASHERVIDELVAIQPAGLTNVTFPLELAAQELGRVSGRPGRVLLLSDCVHNAGPDPRGVVGQLPRLDVLFDDSAEQDGELARDLAHAGRGHVCPVRDHHDVPAALNRIFAT